MNALRALQKLAGHTPEDDFLDIDPSHTSESRLIWKAFFPPIATKEDVITLSRKWQCWADTQSHGRVWQHEAFRVCIVQDQDAELERQMVNKKQSQSSRKLNQVDGLSEFILFGSVLYGDYLEDEWFVTWLLFQLSSGVADSFKCPMDKRCSCGQGHEGYLSPLSSLDLLLHVTDADGDFLLIEAADALPSWMQPNNTENRVFIRSGQLYAISPNLSKTSLPHDEALQHNAWQVMCNPDVHLMRKKVQSILQKRLSMYPSFSDVCALEVQVLLPYHVYCLFKANPQWIVQSLHAITHIEFEKKISGTYGRDLNVFHPKYQSRFTSTSSNTSSSTSGNGGKPNSSITNDSTSHSTAASLGSGQFLSASEIEETVLGFWPLRIRLNPSLWNALSTLRLMPPSRYFSYMAQDNAGHEYQEWMESIQRGYCLSLGLEEVLFHSSHLSALQSKQKAQFIETAVRSMLHGQESSSALWDIHSLLRVSNSSSKDSIWSSLVCPTGNITPAPSSTPLAPAFQSTSYVFPNEEIALARIRHWDAASSALLSTLFPSSSPVSTNFSGLARLYSTPQIDASLFILDALHYIQLANTTSETNKAPVTLQWATLPSSLAGPYLPISHSIGKAIQCPADEKKAQEAVLQQLNNMLAYFEESADGSTPVIDKFSAAAEARSKTSDRRESGKDAMGEEDADELVKLVEQMGHFFTGSSGLEGIDSRQGKGSKNPKVKSKESGHTNHSSVSGDDEGIESPRTESESETWTDSETEFDDEEDTDANEEDSLQRSSEAQEKEDLLPQKLSKKRVTFDDEEQAHGEGDFETVNDLNDANYHEKQLLSSLVKALVERSKGASQNEARPTSLQELLRKWIQEPSTLQGAASSCIFTAAGRTNFLQSLLRSPPDVNPNPLPGVFQYRSDVSPEAASSAQFLWQYLMSPSSDATQNTTSMEVAHASDFISVASPRSLETTAKEFATQPSSASEDSEAEFPLSSYYDILDEQIAKSAPTLTRTFYMPEVAAELSPITEGISTRSVSLAPEHVAMNLAQAFHEGVAAQSGMAGPVSTFVYSSGADVPKTWWEDGADGRGTHLKQDSDVQTTGTASNASKSLQNARVPQNYTSHETFNCSGKKTEEPSNESIVSGSKEYLKSHHSGNSSSDFQIPNASKVRNDKAITSGAGKPSTSGRQSMPSIPDIEQLRKSLYDLD